MRIKKIILYNIGPYIDRNIFDLSSDENRNIVLIGGKNGAGKTTFFKSIKIKIIRENRIKKCSFKKFVLLIRVIYLYSYYLQL